MKKKLSIFKCCNSDLWYADKVGEYVPFVKEDEEDESLYWSIEDDGYMNIVYKEDAILIEDEDENTSREDY